MRRESIRAYPKKTLTIVQRAGPANIVEFFRLFGMINQVEISQQNFQTVQTTSRTAQHKVSVDVHREAAKKKYLHISRKSLFNL